MERKSLTWRLGRAINLLNSREENLKIFYMRYVIQVQNQFHVTKG